MQWKNEEVNLMSVEICVEKVSVNLFNVSVEVCICGNNNVTNWLLKKTVLS